MRLKFAILATAALCGAEPATAQTNTVEEFYKGKTLNVLIGVAAGGEYDLHARLVARFIGKHIPGQPTVVPQNMTGAGGIKMTNFLYQVSPRDGTTIGMIQNNFPIMQAMGEEVVQFDSGQFSWLGSITPTVETMATWRTTGVTSIEDARKIEVVAGATVKGSITYTFPKMMNELLGTRFKIVAGYPGGNDINVAMERGEVGARNNTWSSWKSTKAQWLSNKDIHILVQAGPKVKELPGVPSIEDLARNDDERKIIQLLIAGTKLGRPLATPPGVPADRVKALRAAFDATMKDPDFIKQAEAAKIDIEPVRGEDMQKLVAEVLATPKHLIARAKAITD